MNLSGIKLILLFIPGMSSVFKYPTPAAEEKTVPNFRFIAAITKNINETVGTANIISRWSLMTVCVTVRRNWDPDWRLKDRKGHRPGGYESWRAVAGTGYSDPISAGKKAEEYQIRPVESITNHPLCKIGAKYGNAFDCAVVRVKWPFTFNQAIQPLKFEKDLNLLKELIQKMINGREFCLVTGWGFYAFRSSDQFNFTFKAPVAAGEKSLVLRKMEYKLMTIKECTNKSVENGTEPVTNGTGPAGNGTGWLRKEFVWKIKEGSVSKICAMGVGGKLCDFDDGAPLLCTSKGAPYFVGIYSQSAGCGIEWWDHPTVFSRIDNLVPWLTKIQEADKNSGDKKNSGNYIPVFVSAISSFYALLHAYSPKGASN